MMRLVGRDAEPGKSREHALLSVLAGWRTGASLDVAAWMAPVDGKTPATVVSVAHLDEDERQMVLGVILEEVLTWVRTLPGTSQLRALVVFDEMYGFVPPHPASPPTKRPIVSLMKQARAYGVGVVLATQNPMDLDYRALSNAGLWMLGRLQTDADRERVLEGLGETGKKSPLGNVLKKLPPRWFVVRNSHDKGPPMLLQPRYAISYLRGPMTRDEIRKARLVHATPPTPAATTSAPTTSVPPPSATEAPSSPEPSLSHEAREESCVSSIRASRDGSEQKETGA
ncbi:MAG: ATP-binding protein [Deltaproteobacteria bacterium]|nr:ATP-binding protein [Deltaproteobacteria bacterium]